MAATGKVRGESGGNEQSKGVKCGGCRLLAGNACQ